MYEVMSPLGQTVVEEKWAPKHFDTLNGKTVCEIWNGVFRGEVIFPIIREMLKKRYPGVNIIPYPELPTTHINIQSVAESAKRLEAVGDALREKGCDAVISSQGS